MTTYSTVRWYRLRARRTWPWPNLFSINYYQLDKQNLSLVGNKVQRFARLQCHSQFPLLFNLYRIFYRLQRKAPRSYSNYSVSNYARRETIPLAGCVWRRVGSPLAQDLWVIVATYLSALRLNPCVAAVGVQFRCCTSRHIGATVSDLPTQLHASYMANAKWQVVGPRRNSTIGACS